MASPNSTASADTLISVTPSDTTNLSEPARALYVGGTGDLAIVTPNTATAVVLTNVQAGTLIPVKCVRVNSTSTTATSIVALV